MMEEYKKYLKQRAEKLLGSKAPKEIENLSKSEIKKLLHELNVHEIELEIQNEELQSSQTRLLDYQEKLKKQYKHFFQLYHEAPVAYVTLNTNGIIVQANLQFSKFLGISNSNLEGQPFVNFLASDDQPFFRLKYKALIQQPEDKEIEVKVINKAKQTKFVLIQGKKVDWEIHYKGKEFKNLILLIVQDITESKKTREILLKSKEEAENANNAKSEFLDRMSHELRTPLNAILGFAQLLEREKDELKPEHIDSLNYILHSGEHLLQLIEDIFDLAKTEVEQLKLNLTPLSIKDVIESSLMMVENLAKFHNITINFNLSEDYQIIADKMRLKQVLINFLTNSIKYNKINGTVDVSVQKKNDNYVKISVTDTGLGIKPEDLNNIFEPFKRLKYHDGERIDGTGIGLTISKKLIQQMDGKMGVESEFNKGSTFWFEIQKIDNTVNQNFSPTKIPGDISNLNFQVKIVFIEENDFNFSFYKSLTDKIPNVDSYYIKFNDLSIDFINKIVPDLIYLDIISFDQSLKIVNEIKSIDLLSAIPIIATSNYYNIDTPLDNDFKHFDDFTSKPINLDKLLEHILKVQLNKSM